MNLDFYKGKKVLVTGHTGFKGSWLSKILIMAGADVAGYSLEPPTNPNLFSVAGVEGKMKSVIGDIRDYDIFPDKKLLDNLRSKIIQNLIDNTIPKNLSLEQYINDEIDELRHKATSSLLSRDDVIVVAKESWHHGVIGIVSSKITSKSLPISGQG